MIALLYLIPIFTCITLYSLSGDFFDWKVYASVVAGSMAITGLMHWLMYRHRVGATEFLGSFVYELRHDDAWTEVEEYYETRTDSKGNTYEVKRKRYIHHPEEWHLYTSIGSCISITHSYYEHLAEVWQTRCHLGNIYGSDIVGGVRYYQEYHYDDVLNSCSSHNPFKDVRVFKTMEPITEEHRYVNKIRNSNSIFKFEKISKDEAEQIGLWDYPELSGLDMSPILGLNVDNKTDAYYRLLNAYYGSHYQIRFFFLFYDSTKYDIDIVEKQRAYWYGGNKNEFVVCIGHKDGVVDWCRAFSWMDEPVFAVKLEGYLRDNPTLDMMKMHSWICSNLSHWKRKEFSDFDYINIELSPLQYWIAFAVTCLANAAAVYFLITENGL